MIFGAKIYKGTFKGERRFLLPQGSTFTRLASFFMSGRRLILFTTLLLAVALSSSTVVHAEKPQADDGFSKHSNSLFDGKSLAGWEGDKHWFRVEAEAIVAGNLNEKIPHNQFLCSAKPYGDFELRLEAKIVGPGQNAGIQFRSKRVAGGTEVSGYQADMGMAWKRPVWGALYDESRRRKMLQEPDPDVALKAVKQDDWNEIRIVARGAKIQIYVNGTQTIDYTEPDKSIDRSGVLGLQIHSGLATEAWYRNIRIRTFE